MRQKHWCGLRVVALLLAIVILIAGTFVLSADADNNESETVKHIVSHDVAIVFDNSGSMYDGTDSWCQALYAMEVFASMLDYEHDKLGIYPMGAIQIGKTGQLIDGRLDISSESDVKNIEMIYSHKTAPTILKPAYTAAEYLKGSNLDEKWLIVLTDGEFYFDKDAEAEPEVKKEASWLSGKLNSFAGSTGVNVQYLGFADASKLQSNENNHFYATNAKTADELTTELVKICNKIFQRNVIQTVTNGSFEIDVSMSSLIAFVQGKGAKINALTDANNQTITPTMNTKLESGKEWTGNTSYARKDADISGHVVTYGACAAGTYKLDYTGSDIQVFYEPNVAVKTTLLDQDGKEVDTNAPLLPGDYTLEYGLMDVATGKDVTDSPLLRPVSLNATVSNNGETYDVASGSTITLQADDNTSIDISGTFLKDYTISNSNEAGAFTLTIKPPDINPSDLSVKVEVTTYNYGRKWYKIADHEKWTPIRVDVTYKGEPVPDEALASGVTFHLNPDNNNTVYRTELIPGESAFNVYIGEDESGAFVEPDTGQYTFSADVTIKDEYDREISAKDSDGFEIQVYSAIWRWLIYLVVLAVLILLAIFILTRKAWPRKMQFFEKDDDGNVIHKRPINIGSNMTLVPVFNALSVQARKNTILMKKFGKNANIYVEKVKARGNVESYVINFIEYERAADFLDSTGNAFKGVVGNNTQVHIVYNDGKPDLFGEIKVN